jgi:hypothetical protein
LNFWKIFWIKLVDKSSKIQKKNIFTFESIKCVLKIYFFILNSMPNVSANWPVNALKLFFFKDGIFYNWTSGLSQVSGNIWPASLVKTAKSSNSNSKTFRKIQTALHRPHTNSSKHSNPKPRLSVSSLPQCLINLCRAFKTGIPEDF